MERKYDIEDRCIVFGAEIVKFTDSLPNTKAATHLGGQLLRSGTAPALHYGEVQGAESPRDFIHKMGMVLKELRESKNNMRVQALAGLMDLNKPEQSWLMNECSELIAIFNASIKTAERNNPRKK
jgi:four helix bundle protein